MGEPVFLQYPFVGGLDQKTSAAYLNPEANQSNIVNANFTYVGALNKRQGIWYDSTIASTLINATTIAASYQAPANNLTALSAFGDVILQQAFAWNVKGNSTSFVGQMPDCTVTRRPMPVQGNTVPLIVDNVTSKQGNTLVAAWVTSGAAGQWTINGAFLDPTTNEGTFTIPALNITADTVIAVNLLYDGSLVNLFLVVEATGAANRKLFVYSINPNSSTIGWTNQAAATITLNNGTTTNHICDVAPFVGDPDHGYIVLYLPNGVTNQLTWNYFKGFTSTHSGTLTAGTSPGNAPVYIQADFGIDVVFLFTDNISQDIHAFYYSGDGLFTAITNTSFTPSVLLSFFSNQLSLTGCCRMTVPYLSASPPANFNSQIFLSFWATDTTYAGVNGPEPPITMGGFLDRTGATTVTAHSFNYYPAGMLPIARPFQPVDGLQASASYVHVVQPCVQTFLLALGASAEQANSRTSLQTTEYLIDFRVDGRNAFPTTGGATTTVIATVAPRQISPYFDQYSNLFVFEPHLINPASSDGKLIHTPITIPESGVSGVAQSVGGHWLVTFNLASVDASTAAIINGTTELSGSVPSRLQASGNSGANTLSEHGFIHYPEFCFTTKTGTGLTGTYSYAVCYVRQDGNGNIERSSPYIIPASVVPANQTVNVFFPILSWWANKPAFPNGYMVEIYRTVNLGTTFFCVTRLSPSQFTATSSPFVGSYADTVADAVIASAEILYTTGGLLDNVNPPAARMAIAHRGRYAIVDETLREVWFTKQEIPGEVLGFNEVLIQPFIEGGDITAIASLDDKFVVFKKDSIWLQFGDGPADNGQNSDWTTPQLVPSDVGCSNAKSISAAPAGIVFQASSGFHMLGRDSNVTFIGKGVQDTVAAFPNCVASVAVPSAKQIRWCMQAAEGSNQIILVFDYFLNQWTTHTYTNLDAPIVDLYLNNDVYTVLTSHGTRYQESATSYLDKDSSAVTHFVTLQVVSPWLKISGTQGYQRSRRTLAYGVQNDPCGMTVSLAFNYDSTVKQSNTWTNEQLAGQGQVELHTDAAYSKCESLQVTLSDVDSASKVTGQGMSFDAIGLDMDKIGDRYRRLPARLKG